MIRAQPAEVGANPRAPGARWVTGARRGAEHPAQDAAPRPPGAQQPARFPVNALA